MLEMEAQAERYEARLLALATQSHASSGGRGGGDGGGGGGEIDQAILQRTVDAAVAATRRTLEGEWVWVEVEMAAACFCLLVSIAAVVVVVDVA